MIRSHPALVRPAGALGRRRFTASSPSIRIVLGIAFLASLLAAAGCRRSGHGGRRPVGLVINEMVANARIGTEDQEAVLLDERGQPIRDAEGNPADWVEIYNPTPKPVVLSDYSLTDDRNRPRRYRFPRRIVLQPGQHLVVICDGQPDRGPLHAPFRLAASGQTVFLMANDGRREVDRKSYRGPLLPGSPEQGPQPIEENVSIGHYPDGASNPDGSDTEYGIIYVPTPGARNKPVGVKKPRVARPAQVSPAAEELMPITVFVLEDREILSASLEVQQLESCTSGVTIGGIRGPFQLDEIPELRREVVESRRDFRGESFNFTMQRLTLTGMVPRFEIGSFLRLRVALENVAGTRLHTECQRIGLEKPTLVINEYQPSNQSTIAFDVFSALGQPLGRRFPDWLEIYNYGEQVVDLRGFFMTGLTSFNELNGPSPRPLCPPEEDRPDCLYLWRFDTVGINEIQPGEFLLVVADGDKPPFRTYFIAGEPEPRRPFFSTGFGLSRDTPDLVALHDPDGAVVDMARFDFSGEPGGAVAPDLSFGRFPDAAEPEEILEPGTRFTCPTPGAMNILECDIKPRFGELVWVLPRCPSPAQKPEVLAFLSIDQNTVSKDEPGAPTFEVEFTFTVGDGEPRILTRGPELKVEPLTPFDQFCLRPDAVSGATTFRVSAILPEQPPGTLVEFSWQARDLELGKQDPELGEWVVHNQENSPHTSFRYISGPTKPPVTINEVLPDAKATLIELYPEAVRNDPAFRAPEFAELYNAGDQPFDAGGMFIANLLDQQGCSTGLIRRPRQFRIADGAVIPPKEFLLILMVDPSLLNDAPDFTARPELIEKTVIIEGIHLNNCRESLVLVSSDAEGNCPVDRLDWDFRTDEEKQNNEVNCSRFFPDRSVGRLPDGAPNNQFLPAPTPGESNCPYVPPLLAGEVLHRVFGSLRPMQCVGVNDTVQVDWQALVPLRPLVLQPATFGLQTAELLVEKDGVAQPAIPLLGNPPNLVARQFSPEPPVCQARLLFNAFIPPPQANVVSYRIRLVDTRGGELLAGPFSYGLGSSKPPVAINEAMAVNTDTHPDESGNFVPWIELFNGSAESFDFGGLFLTGDLARPRQWMVPRIAETVVPPGGFLVIFADGEAANPSDLHASITLPAAGPSTLFLLDSIARGNCVLDEFPFDFTGQPPDTSIGRLPDGVGLPRVLPCATPGRSNVCPGGSFIRGDVNFDGTVNISDMAWHFQVLFEKAPFPACLDAFDVDDDGGIDINDGFFIGNFLFLLGPMIPEPYPGAGPDPTPDDLECPIGA